MPYDPERYHRRSICLKGYDYSRVGAYFVTIVTRGRVLLFEDPMSHGIVATLWERIPRDFPHVELDEWVVMPNHIHGIIVMTDVGTTHSVQGVRDAQDEELGDGFGSASQVSVNASPLPRPGPTPGSFGAIVGNFKSVAARRINRVLGTSGTIVWQRNYYDRIIRNEEELRRAREHIANNPIVWEIEDPEHPLRSRQ